MYSEGVDHDIREDVFNKVFSIKCRNRTYLESLEGSHPKCADWLALYVVYSLNGPQSCHQVLVHTVSLGSRDIVFVEGTYTLCPQRIDQVVV
jgi:hypothetical protein